MIHHEKPSCLFCLYAVLAIGFMQTAPQQTSSILITRLGIECHLVSNFCGAF
jgi:hypothetical protein